MNSLTKQHQQILQELQDENPKSLELFEQILESDVDHFEKVEFSHEFMSLLSFKIKESKCEMDKFLLCEKLLGYLKSTIRTFDYNPKFVASMGKTLVTFYRNRKEIEKAIEVLEFLIFYNIPDADGEEFHIQLDSLYRFQKKNQP